MYGRESAPRGAAQPSFWGDLPKRRVAESRAPGPMPTESAGKGEWKSLRNWRGLRSGRSLLGTAFRFGISAPRTVRELRPDGEHPVLIEIVDLANIRLPQAPIATSCRIRKVTA